MARAAESQGNVDAAIKAYGHAFEAMKIKGGTEPSTFEDLVRLAQQDTEGASHVAGQDIAEPYQGSTEG